MAELFCGVAADCKQLAGEARALNLDDALAIAVAGALEQLAATPDSPADDVK